MTPDKQSTAASYRVHPVSDLMVASRVDDFPKGLTIIQHECERCHARVWQSTIAREIASVQGMTTICTQCAWSND